MALTGYGQQQDLRRSKDAGFDRHLVKPVSLDTLRDLLNTLGSGRSSRFRRVRDLDPIARRSGAIKPEMTATGSAVDEPLSSALTRLLAPLGMTYVVRDEAVVLTTAP